MLRARCIIRSETDGTSIMEVTVGPSLFSFLHVWLRTESDASSVVCSVCLLSVQPITACTAPPLSLQTWESGLEQGGLGEGGRKNHSSL